MAFLRSSPGTLRLPPFVSPIFLIRLSICTSDGSDITESPLPKLSRSGFRSWVKQQNLPELYKVYLGEARRIKVFEDILLSNKKPTQIIKELKGWDPDMVQLKLALNEALSQPKLIQQITKATGMSAQQIESRINAGWYVDFGP